MYKEGTGGPGHRARRNSKSRRAAGETRNCPFSVAIETPIPLTVSVDVRLPRPKFLQSSSVAWLGSQKPDGENRSINRRSERAVCEKPRAPLDPGFLRGWGRSGACSRAFPSTAGNEIPQRRGCPG